MRFDLVAIGSRGDVQPYVALARGLRRAGHDVRLVTLAGFEDFIARHAFDHLVIGESPASLMATDDGRDWLGRRHSTVGFLRGFVALLKRSIREGIERYWAAAGAVDAVVASPMALPVATHVAEALGVPMFRVHTSPYAHTAFDWDGRHTLQTALRGRARTLAGEAFRLGIWLGLRRVTNDARRDILGLPAASAREPFRELDQRRIPTLDAYSSVIVQRPPDWGDWIHVTGYWFLDEAEGWQPSGELATFMDAGEPPVFVGFGSTPFPRARDASRVIVEAFARARRRAVVVAGGSGLDTGQLAEHVLSVTAVPHDWLFSRVSAAVHHGGAGVTGAALRAGLPSIVVPAFADQPFWGSRVHALGAGPCPIPANRLSVDALVGALHQVSDPAMRQRTAAIAGRMRREDGVAAAVSVLESGLGASRRTMRRRGA